MNEPPVASFTVSCVELTCTFDGSGSTDTDGTVAGFAWDFGDGTTGTGESVSHTYASAGTRTVTLTVVDDDGASDVTTREASTVEASVEEVAFGGGATAATPTPMSTW